MKRTKFNSKYAAGFDEIQYGEDPTELENQGISVTKMEVPDTNWDEEANKIPVEPVVTSPKADGANPNQKSKWTPEQIEEQVRRYAPQTTTYVKETPTRRPLVTKSPMFAPDPSGRRKRPMRVKGPRVKSVEKFVVAPDKVNQALTNVGGGTPHHDILAQNRRDRLHIGATLAYIDVIHRMAHPCPACGGAFNGGHPVADIGKEHEQAYCPVCENTGIDPNIADINDLQYAVNQHNANAEFHRRYCTSAACRPNCPVNAIREPHAEGCHIDSDPSRSYCVKGCPRIGKLGPIDQIRNGLRRRGIDVERYHTHAETNSNDSVIALTAPRAIYGHYNPKPIARSFELIGGKEGSPIRRGTPIMFINHNTVDPDDQIRTAQPEGPDIHMNTESITRPVLTKPDPNLSIVTDTKGKERKKYPGGEQDEQYKRDLETYNTFKFPNPNEYKGGKKDPGYVKQRENYEAYLRNSLEEQIKNGVNSTGRKLFRDTGMRNNRPLEIQYRINRDDSGRDQSMLQRGYQDKQMFGVVTGVTPDGRVRAVVRGTPLRSVRDELHNRTKGARGDEREVSWWPKGSMLSTMNTFREPGETDDDYSKRSGMMKMINDKLTDINPKFGRRSPEQSGSWITVEGQKENFARISNRSAPLMSVVGTVKTAVNVPSTDKDGNPTTRKQPTLVTHVKSPYLTESEWKQGIIETPDNDTRLEMYSLAKDLDHMRGLRPGDDESLTPRFLGTEVDAINDQRAIEHQYGGKRKGSIKDPKLFMPTPEPEAPTTEAPGVLKEPAKKINKGKKKMSNKTSYVEPKDAPPGVPCRFCDEPSNVKGLGPVYQTSLSVDNKRPLFAHRECLLNFGGAKADGYDFSLQSMHRQSSFIPQVEKEEEKGIWSFASKFRYFGTKKAPVLQPMTRTDKDEEYQEDGTGAPVPPSN